MNIEEVRLYCLSKPFATEDMPFGDGYVTFRIANKIFCGLALTIGCVVQMKCDPAEFEDVIEQYPFVCQAWHWHKKHWIQVDLADNIPTDVLKSLIDRAYDVVLNKLPKKQREQLTIQ